MINRFRFSMRIVLLSLVYGLIFNSIGHAQSDRKPEKKKKGLQVEAAFKPAFFCKPAVNKIKARKGQTIKFEFRIEPAREDVRVEVRPVALRQHETGSLRAALEAPVPNGLRLDGAGQYDLQVGEELVLTGSIKLPNNDSDFHSYGILVQDNGYITDDRGQIDETTFGVKFVSQYILRCDVTIANGRGTDIKMLQIESAQLLERNGFPTAKVMIYNPTDSTLEFELESKLFRPGYVESKKSVGLFAPVNENKLEREKYVTRIFPQSRIRMVASWPDAIFPGEFEMETSINRKRKSFITVRTPVVIGENEFPAQSTFAEEIAQGVQVHPAQVYLSRERGAKRFIPLNLTNFSAAAVDMDVSVVDVNGNPVDWLIVRPEQVQLEPGGKRKVMVSLKSLSDRAVHRIGFIQFSEYNSPSSRNVRLPVAFRGTNPLVPKLATNTLRIDRGVEGGAFVVDVMNQSELPLPIDAAIQFKSSNGNQQIVKAGYGQWLMPEAKRRLEFKIDASVSEGDLPVKLKFVDTKDNLLAEREFTLKITKDDFEEVAELPGKIAK